MREERIFSIIKLLIETTDYITIEKIASELGVSNRTIRNDLIKCEDWLNDKPFQLIKKTGHGILLEGKLSNKLALRKEIREERKGQVDYSPLSRRNYIAIKLLASTESVWIDELADDVYFSKATIQKDLIWVKEVLNNYKIELIRNKNHGLRIEGKERRIRSCLVDLLLNSPEMKHFENLVIGIDSFKDDDTPFKALDLTTIDIKNFMNTLRSGEEPYITQLPLQAFMTLLLMMLISFKRYTSGYVVSLSSEFITSLTSEPLYEEIDRITSKVKQVYNIDSPEVEKRFLQVYLIGQSHRDQKQHQDVKEAQSLAISLVKYWEKQIGFELLEKNRLMEALVDHLTPAITRFKHGLYLENPVLLDIKKVHRQTHEIVYQSKNLIEERFKTNVSEDELGFLTLHLVAALNRMKQPLKTLLVNHIGLGAGNLLEEQLNREIPEIEIMESETYFSSFDISLSKYDLILSTIELKVSVDVPVLYINPLIHKADLLNLHQLIKTLYQAKNDPLKRKNK